MLWGALDGSGGNRLAGVLMSTESMPRQCPRVVSREETGVPGGWGEKRLKRLRFLYAPVARFVAREGGLRPLVVDVGTGSGIVLERVRELVPLATLVGLDIRSEPMRLGAAGLTFVRADAAHLPLAEASVDVVVSRSSFGYCSDHERVLIEILRVLKPGGRALIVDASPGPAQRLLMILLGMVLLRRGWADMSGFSDRALSRKRLIALLSRAGVADYDYGTLFFGTYFRLVLRKPPS
jgi:ubiquinone/menaquinone biosynthesis C-methylase UbiE